MSTKALRKLFAGVDLYIEDLFLLESFQIEYFPGWVPERELASVLWAYPSVHRILRNRSPATSQFLDATMERYPPADSQDDLAKAQDVVIWTIADMIVYNKCPEVYDRLDFHDWDFAEVTSITPLDGKVVVDVGAGTGRVALEAAMTADAVIAVEPVGRLRRYIRAKVAENGQRNVHVVDGFGHSIPMRDDFADVLITSHALGWRLEEELVEFERVVAPGGYVIHCPGTAETSGEEERHKRLVSPEWGYEFDRYREADGWKRKYWKRVTPTGPTPPCRTRR